MGAACGCMSEKSKGDGGNKNRNIQSNKGGVVLGGSDANLGDSVDQKTIRAARFE